jgi:hypothetical protein
MLLMTDRFSSGMKCLLAFRRFLDKIKVPLTSIFYDFLQFLHAPATI